MQLTWLAHIHQLCLEGATPLNVRPPLSVGIDTEELRHARTWQPVASLRFHRGHLTHCLSTHDRVTHIEYIRIM